MRLRQGASERYAVMRSSATLSHIPEKRLEMEKREDSLWRESALGEDVDVKVGKYLRANNQEYQDIRQ